ncbi:MAG: hypothetical protein ABIG87_01375 [Patescibacteria group bacterium]
MSLILEDTGEKTTLQKGDNVIVEFFDNFFTIAYGRDGGRLLMPDKSTRWTVYGDKNNIAEIIEVLSNIHNIVFKKMTETKNTMAFAII